MTERERLTAAFKKLNEKNPGFKPGDIVDWKFGMKNKKSTGPFVVVEVLEVPITDHNENDSGSPYFREPLDLVLGRFIGEGEFITFYYDSRRMELVG